MGIDPFPCGFTYAEPGCLDYNTVPANSHRVAVVVATLFSPNLNLGVKQSLLVGRRAHVVSSVLIRFIVSRARQGMQVPQSSIGPSRTMPLCSALIVLALA